MVKADAAERFMAAPLLADVDPESRRAVLDVLAEDRAAAGSVLLEQGHPNDHLSFLIEGTANLERAFSDGRKELIATLTAPAVFGTTSFFLPTPPTITVRALTDVWLLSLYHPAHDQLRRDHPRAAESLALAVVRVLAERFDLLDKRLTDYMAQHHDDHPKATEWASFRARLFEEPGSY